MSFADRWSLSATSLADLSALTRSLTDVEVEAKRATGFDVAGFPASTWILNAMYEAPTDHDVTTHDEVYRQAVISGQRPRRLVGDVDLTFVGKVGGWQLGWTQPQGLPYRRVLWRDYAARTGRPPVLAGQYPGYRGLRPSTSGSSWPSNIQPPGEGSLDVQSWHALLPYLRAASRGRNQEVCTAFYSYLGSKDWDETKCIYRGALEDTALLVDNPEFDGSPQNLWPDDSAWMVYTDWDGWGTRVSGSHELIAALKADPVLECYDLPHE